ncbi:hypothetical protein CE91St44_01380 [Oscillospiraceae bacterium]|nr:hypothetical protein CE91St44_01380 [Oscillospiraceae bacterium]
MTKGLVLAGGGARGSYQVGVYKALRELGWNPGVITGTSVGCLNGALFALDQWELARDMWLTIDDGQVMLRPENGTGTELTAFLENVVKNGGMDVTPLEQTVCRAVDEAALRAAPVRYGLVTVNKRTLRPLELPLEEIPEGRLVDYMLASAACFPAFRPRAIDGEEFIDGGYADNMPLGLAARMGAEELLAVDVDGVGITRPNLTGLPTTYVRSHWELGSILVFQPETAKRNMALGYQDCHRAFGKVLGAAYALRAGEEKALAVGFARPYARLLRDAISRNPALALAEGAAVLPMEGLQAAGAEKALAPLERACELAGVDPVGVYTARELFGAFLEASDPAGAERFAPLLREDAGLCLKETALAAAAPGEFLQALVRAALLAAE